MGSNVNRLRGHASETILHRATIIDARPSGTRERSAHVQASRPCLTSRRFIAPLSLPPRISSANSRTRARDRPTLPRISEAILRRT